MQRCKARGAGKRVIYRSLAGLEIQTVRHSVPDEPPDTGGGNGEIKKPAELGVRPRGDNLHPMCWDYPDSVSSEENALSQMMRTGRSDEKSLPLCFCGIHPIELPIVQTREWRCSEAG